MCGLRTEHGIEVPAARTRNNGSARRPTVDDPDSERNPVQPAHTLQFPRYCYLLVYFVVHQDQETCWLLVGC